MGRAGVAVDASMRPVDARGASYDNVHVGGRDAGRRRAVAREVRRRASPVDRAPRRRADPRRGVRADPGGGGAMTSTRRPRRADARLARPLRQVHDLRDVLPGRRRHAAVPGAEVRRPAGRALPRARRARRPTPRSTTARAAASARRCARRACTSPRSTRRRGRSSSESTGFKLRDRLLARPDLAGRLGTPGRADRQLHAAQRARARGSVERTLGHPPRRRACRPSPGARSRRWARKHAAPPARTRRVAYFHGCGAN